MTRSIALHRTGFLFNAALAALALFAAPAKGQGLLGRWTFDTDQEATGKWGPLQLKEGAALDRGRLKLGNSGWARADHTAGGAVSQKTLVAWVSLGGLGVGGGAAISLDSRTVDNFDGVVFGERVTNRWMAGSTNWSRTSDVVGTDEAAVNQTV